MHGIEQFPEICDVSLPATSFPLYIRRILMCTRERRLEEQIRELCARVVAEQEPDELKRAIIQFALHEHVEKLRQTVAASLCCSTSKVPPRTRKPR
jgi:hypothetical protein